MAKLYFYYAAMNAGKSTTLLQAAFNYAERGMSAMLFTAGVDDRAGFAKIGSRIGLEAEAVPFDPATDIAALVRAERKLRDVACVLIDEAQFLTRAQVWQLAELCDRDDMPVVTYGLRIVRRFCGAAGAGRQPYRAEGDLRMRAQGDDEPSRRCGGACGERWRPDRDRR
jgi:thymidine kinase